MGENSTPKLDTGDKEIGYCIIPGQTLQELNEVLTREVNQLKNTIASYNEVIEGLKDQVLSKDITINELHDQYENLYAEHEALKNG